MIDMRQHVVDGYLKRLERSMRDVPAARRNEIVSEIRNHIDETLAHLPADATEADVRNAVESVGDPDDIASETRDRLEIRRAQAKWTDTLAVVLLPIGGVIVPFFGWAIGVIFLWISSVWTTKEKLIGTLIVPGGLLPAAWMLLTPASVGTCVSGPDGVMRCTGSPSSVEQIALLMLFAFVTLAPIVVAMYLGRRLRQRSAPA